MENGRPCSANSTPRLRGRTASLLLAFGCLTCLGGSLVLTLEAFHPPGGVDELLFAREKRMAVRADLYSHEIRFISRARFERTAAGAMNRYFMIIRVDTGFHAYSLPQAVLHGSPTTGEYSHVAKLADTLQ